MRPKKKCTRCGKIKGIHLFPRRTLAKDGHDSWCKVCALSYHKRHYKFSKEYRDNFHKYLKRYERLNPHRAWARAVRKSHRDSGYNVNITLDWLTKHAQETEYCEMRCGTKLNYIRGRGFNLNNPTLDRVNNTDNLYSWNVQIICNRCNMSKNCMTMKEFIEYCNLMTKVWSKEYPALIEDADKITRGLSLL